MRTPASVAVLTALALPTVPAVLATPAAAVTDPGGVVISEVNQNLDPTDWVELTNTGDAPVDLSGWALKDDDDTRTYTIPAGTVLAPGEYLVLEQDAPGSFDFGLGKTDEVRLFAPDGAPVDRLAWDGHSVSTYIRIDGQVVQSAEPTPGAANSGAYVPPVIDETPVAGQDQVRITEVASDPTDWIEVTNLGTTPVDVSGWGIRDDDDTRAPWVFPAGTTLAPGERHVVDTLDFGLGKGDHARLYNPNGALVQDVTWTEGEHAIPSWQVCGDDAWALSGAATPGQPNNCTGVVVNEVSTQVSDFVELYNTSTAPVDISGWSILDDDPTHTPAVIPAGTVLAPGAYHVVDEVALGFGLGAPDAVTLTAADGTPVAALAWTEHVRPSQAMCEGEWRATGAATPGAANDCAIPEVPEPETALPLLDGLHTGDAAGTWGEDLSGLDVQVVDGIEILWAVNNGDGSLSRLVRDGAGWTQSLGWPAAGVPVRFPGGVGVPDAEGVSVGTDGAIHIGIERDNAASGTSRNAILRVEAPADLTGATQLVATDEWDLTAILPTTGANGGIEAVEMIDRAALAGLAATGAEVPEAAAYALVGIETQSDVFAVALQADGSASLIGTIPTGLPGVMALDVQGTTLWAVADDAARGWSQFIDLSTLSAGPVLARAAGTDNLANEGAALTPCVDGTREVWFADDSATDGHSLRGGTLACDAAEEQPGEPTESEQPGEPQQPGTVCGTARADQVGGTGNARAQEARADNAAQNCAKNGKGHGKAEGRATGGAPAHAASR